MHLKKTLECVIQVMIEIPTHNSCTGATWHICQSVAISFVIDLIYSLVTIATYKIATCFTSCAKH